MAKVFCERCGIVGREVGGLLIIQRRSRSVQDHVHSWLPSSPLGVSKVHHEARKEAEQDRLWLDIDFTSKGERIGSVLVGGLISVAPLGAAWFWLVGRNALSVFGLLVPYVFATLTAFAMFLKLAPDLDYPRTRTFLILVPVLGGIELIRLSWRLVAVPKETRLERYGRGGKDQSA